MNRLPLICAVLALPALACSEEPSSALDSGSASEDAAVVSDAAAQQDAQPADSGVVQDAGQADSGVPADTGVSPDSGLPPLPGTLTDWCTGQPADFSFFVTSMSALWTLAGDDISDLEGGFGGNFGGLAGADRICQTIGDATGSTRTWRAFLSVTDDGSGSPVHGIDRIGAGPWTDANGRLVASGLSGLTGDRPDGDVQSTSDLPDECGVPLTALGDAHDVVTGSDKQGRLAQTDMNWTCNDWTSDSTTVGVNSGGPGPSRTGVMCGHSFPRSNRSGLNWVSDHPLRGCSPGANLLQNGGGTGTCIGCSGGYGALYCFAL